MGGNRVEDRMKSTILAFAAVATLGLGAAPALAATVYDASGDWLATYTGAQNPDLDILSASVVRSETELRFRVGMGGAIGSSPNSLIVWGIDRGAGTARLGMGAPPEVANVLFDAVYVMFPDGTARLVTIANNVPTINVLPNSLTIAGDSIWGSAPLSLLPSTGFDVADYRFTLWSRQRVNPAVDGTNAEIADFLLDGASIRASVPEPGAWALLIAGFGLVGGAIRRREKRLPA